MATFSSRSWLAQFENMVLLYVADDSSKKIGRYLRYLRYLFWWTTATKIWPKASKRIIQYISVEQACSAIRTDICIKRLGQSFAAAVVRKSS